MAVAGTLEYLISVNGSKLASGLSDAENRVKQTGSKLGKIGTAMTSVAGKIGKVGVAAAKGIAVAGGAAVTAIAGLTKSAVNAYKDYEQLVGGVETLFGAGGKSLEEYQKKVGITEKSTDKQISKSIADYNNLLQAQSDVLDNAQQAYLTAGVDANTYMETVTSFSAALISSLKGDTVAAAKAADQALIDMSDNSNKMGTSLESIQNAYQGFAKQNYTMLDNLNTMGALAA